MAAVLVANRRSSVDIRGHHAMCEMNYHQMLSLLPGLMEEGVDSWSYLAGCVPSEFRISMTVIERARYTTILAVEQHHDTLDLPRISVRLYHDVQMAEIVSWDGHRHWFPEYDYPNPKMYHRDEKLALNQFLGDWLNFCKRHGLIQSKSVMQFT